MRSRPERQTQAAGRTSQVADAVAAGPERNEDELDDAVLLAISMPTAASAAAAAAQALENPQAVAVDTALRQLIESLGCCHK